MSETLKGKAIIWGAQGIGYTAGVTSATNPVFHQNAKLSRSSDKKDIPNDAGETVGQCFSNKKKTIRVTLTPYGTSTTAAKASWDAWCSAPPSTTVTITDTTSAVFAGSYNLLSSEATRTADGIGQIDAELEIFDDNDVTGTIS